VLHYRARKHCAYDNRDVRVFHEQTYCPIRNTCTFKLGREITIAAVFVEQRVSYARGGRNDIINRQ